VRVARRALAALAVAGLVGTTAGVAQAHTPGISWRARAVRYEQVATTKTRVLVGLVATSFRDNPARMRCKMRPSVRVEDAAGNNAWFQAKWTVRWKVPANRRSAHAWWLGVDHPEGTANGWKLGDAVCHA
jgi:hypothetical protein